jgi:hypothetical protein
VAPRRPLGAHSYQILTHVRGRFTIETSKA